MCRCNFDILWRALLIGGGFCMAQRIEGGELRWQQTEISTNAILGQTELAGVFRMRNEGAGNVRVTKVSSSCACSKMVAPTNALAPGAWGEVRAVYDLRGRSGELPKLIAVETDEPGGVPYILHFTVRIPPWMVLDTREVKWARDDTAASKVIGMRLADGVPRLSVRAESSSPRVRVELMPVGEREFRLDVRPDLSMRPLGASILLTGEGALSNSVAEVCRVMVK